MENMKKYVAEFIGTLVLVLFACGTAAVVGCNGADPNAAYLMTALAFGPVSYTHLDVYKRQAKTLIFNS